MLVCRHTHKHIHMQSFTLIITQYLSHTDDVVSVSRLSSENSSRVTAVIHQWQLINQKCQQHLLLHHAVTMVTRGGEHCGVPQLCPLRLVTQDPCQSVPVNASLNWQGYISWCMDCSPKRPSFPYGASGERLKLSSSFMKVSTDTNDFAFSIYILVCFGSKQRSNFVEMYFVVSQIDV